MPEASHRKAEGFNPLCGDKATVFLRARGRRREGRELRGRGLLDLHGLGLDDDRGPRRQDAAPRRRPSSSASTSWSRPIPRRPRGNAAPSSASSRCSRASREFPVRVKCASLPWHTFKAALAGGGRAIDGVTGMREARTLSRDVEVAAIPYGDKHHPHRGRHRLHHPGARRLLHRDDRPRLHGPDRGQGRRRDRRGADEAADRRGRRRRQAAAAARLGPAQDLLRPRDPGQHRGPRASSTSARRRPCRKAARRSPSSSPSPRPAAAWATT